MIDDKTFEDYKHHNESMLIMDQKFQDERFKHLADVAVLNDRRYSEVNVEKEKALKIKETADLAALELARESQKYKEERNDAMREQNLGERGQYVTHEDLTKVVQSFERALKPLIEFIQGHEGAEKAVGVTKGMFFAGLGAIATIITLVFFLMDRA